MRKANMIIAATALAVAVLAGCGSKNEAPDAGTQVTVAEANGETAGEASATSNESPDANITVENTIKEDEQNEPEDVSEAAPSDENTDEASEETEEVTEVTLEDAEAAPSGVIANQPIVWLGDSLTQGSLGDDNDNLANAPYERLKKRVNVPVEGYGMYGYTTHEVLWTYTDAAHLNQKADPNKTYIFWLGSCDWAPPDSVNSNTAPVIKEIDRFINLDGGIKNYIVIGTTSRWRLGDLYIPINKDLAAHYGVHYMDVIDIINKYGYSEDNTHLSQASYDAIADAVYNKLKSLGYI